MKNVSKILVAMWALLFNLTAYAFLLNNPYPTSQAHQKIYYSSFSEQPKNLDPAIAYASNEYLFLGQIYEPVLGYDYYKRPYELAPLTAVAMPKVAYLNKDFQPESKKENVAYSVYTITIQPGIYYQPHPAFATSAEASEPRPLGSGNFPLADAHGADAAAETMTEAKNSNNYLYLSLPPILLIMKTSQP